MQFSVHPPGCAKRDHQPDLGWILMVTGCGTTLGVAHGTDQPVPVRLDDGVDGSSDGSRLLRAATIVFGS